MESRNQQKIEYFAGETTTHEWAGVYYYSPHVPATFQSHGEIYAAISLGGPTTFDASVAGNLLLDELHESYFESEDDSCLIALEKACLKVKKRLLELLENDEISSEQGIEFHLIAGVMKDNYLYISSMGDGKILGFRDDEVADITTALRDPDGHDELLSGSIGLEEGDKFLFLTPNANDGITEEEQMKIFNKYSLSLLKAKNISNKSLSSALLMRFGEDVETEVEENEFDQRTEEMDEEDSFSLRRKFSKIETKAPSQKEVDEDNEYEDELLENAGDETKVKRKFLAEKFDQIKDGLSSLGLEQRLRKIKIDRNSKTFQVILISAYQFIVKYAVKFWHFLINDLLQINSNRPLRMRGAGRGRINWRPIVFVLVIVIVAGYFLIDNAQKDAAKKKREADATTQLNSIEANVTKLSKEVSDFALRYDETTKKTDLHKQLKSQLTQLTSVELFPERKTQIAEQVNKSLLLLERKIVVSNPTLVKDFGLIEKSKPSDIDISVKNSQLFISDESNGTIFSMTYQGGDVKKIAEGLISPNTISVDDSNELIFHDKNSERVLGAIKLDTNTLNRVAGVNDARMGNVNQLEAAKIGDNDLRLYGTRENSSEVVQLDKANGSYGLPKLRLSGLSLGKLIDIDIDSGRVYVLSQDSGLHRFLGQTEFKNSVRGMLDGDSWNGANCMTVDSRFIYLGDNSKKRILVFTKFRGDNSEILDLVAQYDLSSLSEGGQIKDIVSDREKGALFVLAGTKVLKLNLEDLKTYVY